MAKVGWTVQSAFYGRNSHSNRESSPIPCREAAQSNKRLEPTRLALSVYSCAWGRAAQAQR